MTGTWSPNPDTLYGLQQHHTSSDGCSETVILQRESADSWIGAGSFPGCLRDLTPVGGSAYAIGSSVLRYHDGNFELVDAGATADTFSVWGSSTSDVYLAQNPGQLLHFDGSGWDPVPGLADLQLVFGGWGDSQDNHYLVSIESFAHFDGSSWTVCETDETVAAVGGVGDQVVMLDGSAQVMLTLP